MWIAQLSDPHLRPAGQLLKDVVDSNAAFAAAIAQVNALDPLPDLVLLSGDLTEHGTPAEYAMGRALLASLRPPLLAIPGNHDDREGFRASFAKAGYLPPTGPLHYAVTVGPLRIVALDVTVPGQHHGEVTAAALEWLAGQLAAAPAQPTLLMLHQPPISCGIPYLDTYRCFGEAGLAALLRQYPAVERVLCGHVHRAMQQRFGGTLLCTAPSTATAIALRTRPQAKPASTLGPAAFLLHHWRPGEGVLTHHVPIGVFPGPFGFA